MNETMGAIIARLRKQKGLTQEQLANELGISYQAVSKWETGNSCPDIATLPLLAELFGVSIDELFGFGSPAEEPEEQALPPVEPEFAAPARELPWPDDDSFYAVLYHGHRLIGSQAEDRRALQAQQRFCFQYEGPAQDVNSVFDLEIEGEVYGNACAGGDLHCGNVGGGVEADGDVSCDSVGGAVNAGGDVSCDSVGGAVNAGGDVTCDAVYGNINAGGGVKCDDVQGKVEVGIDLGEELGEMAAWGAELGRRISETVEKKIGRQWSVHKSWPFGNHTVRVDMDLDMDDEKSEDEE